jgi:hypothetical protein
MSAPLSWLLLLYSLSAKKSSVRVSLWRKLKKCGALPLKTTAYVLPDEPSHYEKFLWLAKQVRDGGGEATLIKVTEIEGLKPDEIVGQFQALVARDYDELLPSVTRFVHDNRKKRSESFDAELDKFSLRFDEIRKVDFFESPRAQDVQMLLRRADSLRKPKEEIPPGLQKRKFQGRIWLTRPRPEIDRVGSAWLIHHFIDLEATFVFAASPKEHPKAIPYDMFEVEFTHHGDRCTFETLLWRFSIEDKRLAAIGEMIHDADLEDDKFHRPECIGVDRVLKGWTKRGLSDAELLSKGFELFDALYASLKK